MKIYTFGAEDAPVLLLLPGTCCHWKSNFGAVIPLLADSFRVLCVSYDGFDETEQTEFSTMLEETKKIEAYLKNHCGGHIRAAYGCSLGGSFVGLLAARQNIHMDYGILGSSDLDQASPLAASLQTNLLLPLIYPVVRDGKFKAKFLQKQLEKHTKESGDYVKAFLKMFGDARPYITMQSCKNQFYSDLITPLPDNIHVPGTQIHIFYALKMGKKYRARYQQHFVHAKSELSPWDSRLQVSSRGYMLGYSDLKDPSVSGFFRFLAKVGDGMMKMQIVKIRFSGREQEKKAPVAMKNHKAK